MYLLVVLVSLLVLPPLLIVSVGIVAVSVTTTTATVAPLCKGDPFRWSHLGDYSIAVLVKEIQSVLAVIGIMIVTGGEIVLEIHLEVSMLCSALSQERVGNITLFGVVSHDLLFRRS
jgi:hypothetical protein